jgi:hypothetical protein
MFTAAVVRGAAGLVNAGDDARTDSDEDHDAKYDILHDKNLHTAYCGLDKNAKSSLWPKRGTQKRR